MTLQAKQKRPRIGDHAYPSIRKRMTTNTKALDFGG